MRISQKCLLTSAFTLLTASAGFAQAVSWKDDDSVRATRASATVIMNRDCDNPSISYSFKAAKRGINGSGSAVMTFVLLDKDGGVAFKKVKTLNMGAQLDGLNEKRSKEKIQFFDCNFFGAVGGYLKVKASDRDWLTDAQSVAQDIIDNVVNEARAIGAKDIAKAYLGGEFVPF